MLETTIRSRTGSQIITVSPSANGIKIKAVGGRSRLNSTINIFSECVPDLIEALQKLSLEVPYAASCDSAATPGWGNETD